MPTIISEVSEEITQFEPEEITLEFLLVDPVLHFDPTLGNFKFNVPEPELHFAVEGDLNE